MLKKELLKEIKVLIEEITINDRHMLKLKIEGKMEHNLYWMDFYEVRRYAGYCLRVNSSFKKEKLVEIYDNLKKYVDMQKNTIKGITEGEL